MGPAYLRAGAGRFGPATQGGCLELVADGTTVLAQADIWMAASSYPVVGRLVALPGHGPGTDPCAACGALASPQARRSGGLGVWSSWSPTGSGRLWSPVRAG